MRRWHWLGGAVLAAYAAVSLAAGATNALAPGQSQDLAPVYMAARLWRQGLDPYRAYSAAEWQQATGATEVPANNIVRAYSTPYPPIALIDLAGISGFEWQVAKRWWLAINVALAVYVPWLVRRLWFSRWTSLQSFTFFAIWFGGIGLRVGLGNGQHALFWFAMMLSAFWLMSAGRMGWAGVPLALSLHKYPLTAVFVPYLIAGRAFRLLLATVVVSAVLLGLFLIGLRVEPLQVVASFLREIEWWYSRSDAGGLPGLGITHFYPVLATLAGGQMARVAMYLLLVGAVIATCWPRRAEGPLPPDVDVACLLLLLLWGSYHSVYDTIVLILPLCVLAARWPQITPGWRQWMMAALIGLLLGAWYADASSVYRRFDPVPLDRLPESGVYGALTLVYRLVVAAAFAAVLMLRYRPATLILAPRGTPA